MGVVCGHRCHGICSVETVKGPVSMHMASYAEFHEIYSRMERVCRSRRDSLEVEICFPMIRRMLQVVGKGTTTHHTRGMMRLVPPPVFFLYDGN